MKTKLFLLIILLLSGTLNAQEESKSNISFIIKGGVNIGIAGYNVVERGELGVDFTSVTTEYLPLFLLNTMQFGIGQDFSPQLYLALVPGIWFSEDFSRFAFTPMSVFGKYALTHKKTAPTLFLQGGIFIETELSLFGFFINPAIGIEFNRTEKAKWHISAGYLFTYWGLDTFDPGDPNNITNDKDVRHAVSISMGATF